MSTEMMPTGAEPLTAEELLARLDDAERQLAQLQDALVESQRLAAIGTVAAAVAHEFNNLLTPMISYSQFALSGLDKGEPDMVIIEKALRRGATNAEKAGRICSGMLNLSRGSRGGTADLQQIIDEVLAVLARDPSKDGIALRVQVPTGLRLRCDAVQVEQVLLNLLINAKQAMETTGGGRLTVTAELEDETVHLRVSDTGPGIDPKLRDRVFDPFFTTKSATTNAEGQRGTGLGLAICRRLVHNNGGTIDVESELGRGTTFAIRLPAAA
ncbi:MAG: ATP-binding protein [Planctomycetota bacterium]